MSESRRQKGIDRRSFLALGTGALSVGALLRNGFPDVLAQVPAAAGGYSTVETNIGRVRGVVEDGVHTFKGVPYAASPAGAGRFMPPAKHQPWTGVRDTIAYGPRAVQPFRRMVPYIGDALVGPGPQSEDCLLLNVWTPGPARNSRRPVMVWFHGGGFRTGSGNSVFYAGKELAQRHGAVVVTVTHRLNAMGFLYLSDIGGEKYRDSSNMGMRDIVMALEWVRDNIDAFGGNPGNVTIFGQSGGGGKTAVLNGVPSAKGLFHRAIIQSTLWDTAIEVLEPHEASEATAILLSRVGLKANQLDALQQMPTAQLMEALTGKGGVANGQGSVNGGRTSADGDISLRFVPLKDDRVITIHPFHPNASELSATVPMMTGSNETEGIPYANPDDPFWKSEVSDDAGLRAQVARSLRIDVAEAGRMVALYRKGRPNETSANLALIINADNGALRLSSYAIAERKVAQAKAPAYMYFFKWRSPVENGKLRSMHCMELPFVFDHPENTPFMTGTGPAQRALAANVSEAWVSFARNGDPNHSGLPHWPQFDATKRATMVFDNQSEVVNDPHGEERRAIQALRDKQGLRK